MTGTGDPQVDAIVAMNGDLERKLKKTREQLELSLVLMRLHDQREELEFEDGVMLELAVAQWMVDNELTWPEFQDCVEKLREKMGHMLR